MINYAIAQRLRFIDRMLAYYGSIGRHEIIDYFGIEKAQATRDLKQYQELNPENMIFNNSSKRYLRTDTFKSWRQ
jgi:hypothetical protein